MRCLIDKYLPTRGLRVSSSASSKSGLFIFSAILYILQPKATYFFIASFDVTISGDV